jgi:hypothetical protein
LQCEVLLASLLERGDIIGQLKPLEPRTYNHSEDEEHFGSIHLIAAERPGLVQDSSDEETSLNDIVTITNNLPVPVHAAARFGGYRDTKRSDEAHWLAPSGPTSPAKRGIDLMQSRLVTNKHYLHQREAKLNDEGDYGSAVESETTVEEDERELPQNNYQAELETTLIYADSPSHDLDHAHGDNSHSEDEQRSARAGGRAGRDDKVRRAKRNVVLRKPCRNQRTIAEEGGGNRS